MSTFAVSRYERVRELCASDVHQAQWDMFDHRCSIRYVLSESPTCVAHFPSIGIGRGTAIELGNDICKNLFLADIDAPGLAETKRQVQAASPATRVETYIVDIADESSVQQMVDACVDLYGRMDYAVNIAGVVPHRMGIAEVAVATYDKVIEINEYGVSLVQYVGMVLLPYGV